MQLVEDLFRTIALQVHGTTAVEYQGQLIDLGPAWQRVSIPEVIVEKTDDELDRAGAAAGGHPVRAA